MDPVKEIDRVKGYKKTIAAVIVAALICLPAFSSFSSNGNAYAEIGEAEENVQTEVTQEEAEGAPDTENDVSADEAADNTKEETTSDKSDKNEEDLIAEDSVEEHPAAVKAVAKAVALKASNGEKVSYTAKRVGSNAGETSVFTVTSGGTTYTGACAEQGVSMKTSGTASITKIDNSSKIAKAVFYFAIALGDENWWTSSHKTDKVGKILGMDHASDTDVTKRRMIECFCQIHNMGATKWYKTVTSSSGGGWSTGTAKKVRNYYNNLDVNGIAVPEGFEIWYASSDNGAQSFIMWAYNPPVYNPPGYVTMNKVSGDTSITG